MKGIIEQIIVIVIIIAIITYYIFIPMITYGFLNFIVWLGTQA